MHSNIIWILYTVWGMALGNVQSQIYCYFSMTISLSTILENLFNMLCNIVFITFLKLNWCMCVYIYIYIYMQGGGI